MKIQICRPYVKETPSLLTRYRFFKYGSLFFILLVVALTFFHMSNYLGTNHLKAEGSVAIQSSHMDNIPVLVGVKANLNSNQKLSINLSVEPNMSKTNKSLNAIHNDATTRSTTARQRLPQAIIIGISKAGTRALNDYLTLNPNIKATKREVHFFDRDGNYSKGYGWYKSQLAYSEEGQLTIERTPRYVVNDKVPERIFKMNNSIKIILIVKEPLTRAISEYAHNCADNKRYRRKTFEEYAITKEGDINEEYRPIRKSVYFRYMPKWYRYFSHEQIYVVDGDKLVANPLQELQNLEKFLGVNPEITEENLFFNETKGFYCMKKRHDDAPKCLPKNKGRPHPVVRPEVVSKLHDYFRPWNVKFFTQIGRQFDWP